MESNTTSSWVSPEDFIDLDPQTHHNLALEHWERFEQSGERDELEKSIIHDRAALKLRPNGHPDRSRTLYNLAVSLDARYKRWGHLEDLEEAVELNRAALELRLEGHPDRSMSLSNFANSLRTRYEQQGRTEDLEEAIKLERAALELQPEGHTDRSLSLNNLANELTMRYEQQGRTEDLEEAIELNRVALKLRSEGHPDRSISLNNLASSLTTRYWQQGREEDLEDAIELHRAALELRPKGHPDRSLSLNNLAVSLKTLYERQGREEVLEDAIELHRATLELRPEGHPHRSMSLNNLAISLRTRYERQGMTEDLEEAIKLDRAALELQPEGHPDRLLTFGSLAVSLKTRYEWKGRTEDLEEAIESLRATLELGPEGHPLRSLALRTLANALYAHVEKQWHPEEFEECMQLLEFAVTHEFSGLLDRLTASRQWVTLARLHDHTSVFTGYKATISILQHALTINPTLREQHDFLLRNSDYRALSLEAASYAIEKNRLEQAVEILEQGRGLLWSQLRGLRTPLDELAEANRELADRFRDVSESLGLDGKLGRKSFDELLKLKRQLSNEQEEILNDIRRLPGFERFLQATPFKVLQQAASEGPVIMVNHCKYRSDALIVLPRDNTSVICVPLDNEFYEDSTKLCNELAETRRQFGVDSSEFDVKLHEAMRMVWERVVSNVVVKLNEYGVAEGSRIWWCPTSILSLFPFHAAGPYEDTNGATRYLLDDYVSSYTPTLEALIKARVASVEEEPRLLVIGDLRISSKLRRAKQEIRNIRNCGMNVNLLSPSRSTVLKALRETTWVHFTCHGSLDSKPFGSSFNLSDGGLTMLDIVRASSPNAEFAFLSACHTAEQHHDGAYDETLHLAAAMQFSGFRSVIGSMWELLDEDGPALAKAVYEYINDGEDGEVRYKRAAGGLRKAALELEARDGIQAERWVNLVHIGA
ncbi:uncharacterized protein FOMMEDRAFT_115125 [Fomitiporia mediterranea MF3/22]|uniref:CHAT domain-containing protein n=1 Tax=Fomitiporia mediterranea (strain MF3/22) TaxID=694068 RepID=R7SHN6_FOMME|nr:uncharacterized protein FOMMEDRAFT_115125 [Fomitiporia mediterranea MF3/22]EJC97787.1 hypothetical protein FOMMEDRAFT_115125 [Fomitiporia mediterranea MF3/22]